MSDVFEKNEELKVIVLAKRGMDCMGKYQTHFR